MSCHIKILPWLDKDKRAFLSFLSLSGRRGNGPIQSEVSFGCHMETLPPSVQGGEDDDPPPNMKSFMP